MGKDFKSKKYKGKNSDKRSQEEKRDYKDRDRDSQSDKTDYYRSQTNDYRWYGNNQQLLADVSSLSYGYANGTRLHFGLGASGLNANTLPGICAIKYVPTIGWSDSNTSPVNVCARKLFSYIRSQISGNFNNYNSPDFIMFLLAMDSAISYLEYLKRLYGTISISNSQNRYYPRAIIAAQRADYDELIRNMTDFRAYINMFVVRLGSLCIPANMSLMAKHKWMNQGYYLDSTSPKAQTYIFIPEGFHIYERDTEGAGRLTFHPLGMIDVGQQPPDILSLDQLMAFGDAILEPLLYGMGEEDFQHH